MVRHIVLWRLKSPAHTDFAPIRAALEAQVGRIPGLLRVEVSRTFNTGKRATDFALLCDFEDREALIAEHWIADYEL